MLISLLALMFVACGPEHPSYDPSLVDTGFAEDTGDIYGDYDDASCEYSERSVGAEEDIGLGFTAQYAAEALAGEREAVSDWVYESNERTLMRLSMDVSAAGAVLYEAFDAGCADYLELSGVLQISTEDGWIQEAMPVSLELLSGDQARVWGSLDWDERSSDFTPSTTDIDRFNDPVLYVVGETGADDVGLLYIGGRDDNNHPMLHSVTCWGPDGCVEIPPY